MPNQTLFSFLGSGREVLTKDLLYAHSEIKDFLFLKDHISSFPLELLLDFFRKIGKPRLKGWKILNPTRKYHIANHNHLLSVSQERYSQETRTSQIVSPHLMVTISRGRNLQFSRRNLNLRFYLLGCYLSSNLCERFSVCAWN